MLPTLSIIHAHSLNNYKEKGKLKMAPGEPPVYDENHYYRIIQDVKHELYMIQYKKWFRWKTYTKEGHPTMPVIFHSLKEARAGLLERINSDKQKKVKKYKGKEFIIHKVQ